MSRVERRERPVRIGPGRGTGRRHGEAALCHHGSDHVRTTHTVTSWFTEALTRIDPWTASIPAGRGVLDVRATRARLTSRVTKGTAATGVAVVVVLGGGVATA